MQPHQGYSSVGPPPPPSFLGIEAKHIQAFVACFQNFACAGLLYGWTAISNSLLLDSESGPGLSPARIHEIFAISCAVNLVAPLFLGLLLDGLGPRACSSFSVILVGIGCLVFGYSNQETFDYFLPGMLLIAFGGPGVQSATIHVSNRFPTAKATATSIITGSFSLSFAVFLIFDKLWSTMQLDFKTLFVGYSFVCLGCLVLSLLMWPDQPYSFEEEIKKQPELAEKDPEDFSVGMLRQPSVFKKNSLGVSNAPPTPQTSMYKVAQGQPKTSQAQRMLQQRRRKNLKQRSFWRQLRSAPFVRLTVFFCIGTFWANAYMGWLAFELGDQQAAYGLDSRGRSNAQAQFTAMTTLLGVLGLPFVGYLMDKKGFPWTAVTTAGLAAGFGLCCLVPSAGPALMYLGFALYSVFRTFLFTYFFACLADALGFRFFGVLSGVSFLLAGLVGLLQVPITTYAVGTCHKDFSPDCSEGNWAQVNLFQLISFALLFVFPIMDFQDQAKSREMDVPRYSLNAT